MLARNALALQAHGDRLAGKLLKEAPVEEEIIKKPQAHEVGMPLDAMSVEELEQRIDLLKGEINRLKAAIDSKSQTRKAAESIFKF
jgi:uncharacterized small protein (DUF1192 family)